MVRDILAGIETGALAQIGLLAFVAAFVAVLVYALTLRKETVSEVENLPLLDPDELVQPLQ
jgi:cbb3-type cytochrome oxidase subunit 3